MLVTNAMLMLASFTVVEAPQLYYFTSDNCPACKQVQPVVEELADHGVPIVRVNAQQQQKWTQQAKVTSLPTFIVVGDGKETGRLVGAVGFRDLSQMYFSAIRQVAATKGADAIANVPTPNALSNAAISRDKTATRNSPNNALPSPPIQPAGFASSLNTDNAKVDNATVEQVRGQSNRLGRPGARLGSLWDSLKGRKKTTANCKDCQGDCVCPTNSPPKDPLRIQPVQYQDELVTSINATNVPEVTRPSGTIEANGSYVKRALNATVRLKIVDELGQSFGTGTIIDVHKDEALVLTCGHIFRDSDGKGKVLCDSFAPGARPGIEGKVISFDIRRDIGLVSFRPGVPVKAVAVGGTSQRPREAASVFAIGCNRGDDPTVIKNKIIAVNRYHGPPNLVVGGRPIDGRSGGGLFNETGSLIGVCNAADPEYDEGLYAALGNVHAELDSVGLGFIYRQKQPSLALANATAKAPKTRTRPPIQEPRTAQESRVHGALTNDSPLAPIPQRTASETTEFAPQAAASQKVPPPLVAKIRSPNNPEIQTELVIERPSKDLLDQLMREANQRGPHRQTQLQTANNYSEGWRSLAPRN